jgi:predicted permease
MTPSDLRFALRQMARAPLLSGVVIAVLGLGIAINAGLVTVLHVYVWRPAPGIDPDPRLARLTATASPEGYSQRVEVTLSFPEIRDLREQRQVFSDVAAWGAAWLPTDFGNGAETVAAYYATGNYFHVLRVAMAAGTGFPEGTDRSSAPIAVIAHALWMKHYDGSPTAIGQTVRIRNTPFTIVGVAPPRFIGVDVESLGRPTVWIPLGARAIVEPGAGDDLARRDAAFLRGFARLAPGIRAGEVGRMTALLASRLAQQEPTAHADLAFRAERLSGMARGQSSTGELITAMAIVAALIVLITCTNVSALLLGRAVARRREVAVRLALGATRLRIVRQMLTESLGYALGGALFGLGLYAAGIEIGYATVPGIIPGLRPTPATFLGAAALALVTTIACGLAPALHASRAGIGEVIKNSGPQGIRRSRLQAAFVVLQLASSQPVLVVTGLVLVDVSRGMNGPADRAPASLVTMYADLLRPRSARPATPEARDSVAAADWRTLDLIRQRVALIPGVELAAVSAGAGGGRFETGDGGVAAEIRRTYVTAEYFAAHGIPLVRGRAIGTEDEHRGSVAAVVNEAAAARLWPGADPIGERLVRRTAGPAGEESMTLEVIGVAGQAPDDGNRRLPVVFVPLARGAWDGRPVIAVRTSGDARPLVPRIRATIREVEPNAAVDDVRTLAERDADRRRQATQGNAAAFAVGAAALLLASLGLYAVIAFGVAQRTREIGVRLAIGASPDGVVRHFLRHGLKVAGLGLAIGIPVTVAGIRLVRANMVGFTPRVVAAVLVVVPVLISVAALASWLPARRAGRVDPLVALRSE